MDRPRFFVPMTVVPGTTLALPRDVAHHILVRRLAPGAEIVLFNGHGGEFTAEISDIGKHDVIVVTKAFVEREVELPYPVLLAQGISSADNMDWTIEKATEVGASAVVPLEAERSVVRLNAERAQKRHAHWSAVVRAACEQCGRNTLPSIYPIQPVRDFVAGHRARLKLIASPRARLSLVEWARRTPAEDRLGLTLMIGPEGGWSDSEEAAALDAGFTPVSLGGRVLRTETAGAVAIAMLQAIWGDCVAAD